MAGSSTEQSRRIARDKQQRAGSSRTLARQRSGARSTARDERRVLQAIRHDWRRESFPQSLRVTLSLLVNTPMMCATHRKDSSMIMRSRPAPWLIDQTTGRCLLSPARMAGT
jgi:hypothetical protein